MFVCVCQSVCERDTVNQGDYMEGNEEMMTAVSLCIFIYIILAEILRLSKFFTLMYFLTTIVLLTPCEQLLTPTTLREMYNAKNSFIFLDNNFLSAEHYVARSNHYCLTDIAISANLSDLLPYKYC